MYLVRLLERSSWTAELECAFEKFSFGTFLDYIILNDRVRDIGEYRDNFPKGFFDYLKANVSLPIS